MITKLKLFLSILLELTPLYKIKGFLVELVTLGLVLDSCNYITHVSEAENSL